MNLVEREGKQVVCEYRKMVEELLMQERNKTFFFF